MTTNVPNWRTGEGYPDASASLDRWDYEFLLRGPKREKLPKPYFDHRGLSEEDKKQFGYDSPFSFLRGPLTVQPQPEKAGSARSVMYFDNWNPNRQHCFLFLLDEEIEPQIAKAKSYLTLLQQHIYGPAKARKRTTNYREYLRVLDAVAEGATHEEIARTVFPGTANTYPDYGATKKVRNGLRAAKRLCIAGVKPTRQPKPSRDK